MQPAQKFLQLHLRILSKQSILQNKEKIPLCKVSHCRGLALLRQEERITESLSFFLKNCTYFILCLYLAPIPIISSWYSVLEASYYPEWPDVGNNFKKFKNFKKSSMVDDYFQYCYLLELRDVTGKDEASRARTVEFSMFCHSLVCYF